MSTQRKFSSQFCPVPAEQQPVNEYEALKEAWLFRWGTLSGLDFLKKILWVAFWVGLLSAPIAAASFPPQKKVILFGLATALGVFLLLGLLLLRILLGWYYVGDRLRAEKVTYEESGWYDGQAWPKPEDILARDRLIVSYQINPVLQRLQRALLILAVLTVGDLSLWLAIHFVTKAVQNPVSNIV